VDAEVKKIEPTKKIDAPTIGDQEVLRLMGTPTAKQVEPTTKSHAIQAVARSDGVGTGGSYGAGRDRLGRVTGDSTSRPTLGLPTSNIEVTDQ
jgi:hypothetical protein